MPDQERELTPEQEADVRRLLAEARATEPVPPEVAARLDRVLVELAEERDGVEPTPIRHVVAPAWRRRRATVLLAAAAAVVAIGVGLGQLDGFQGSDDDGGGATDSAVSAQREESADRDGGDEAGGQAPNEAVPDDSASDLSSPPSKPTPIGRVRDDSFTADANQLRRAFPDDAADGRFVRLVGDQLPPGYVYSARAFDCAPARWGAGVLVPVFYKGTPAVLAYRPVTGDSQIVVLLQCGTGESLHSTTLQAG